MRKQVEFHTIGADGRLTSATSLPSLTHDACLIIDHEIKEILVFVGTEVPRRIRRIYFANRAAINLNISQVQRSYQIRTIDEPEMKKYRLEKFEEEFAAGEEKSIASLIHMFTSSSVNCLGLGFTHLFLTFGRDAAMGILEMKKIGQSEDLATITKNVLSALAVPTPWLHVELLNPPREMRKIANGDVVTFIIREVLEDFSKNPTGQDTMVFFLTGFIEKLLEVASGHFVQGEGEKDGLSVIVEAEILEKISKN
ncbi:MAG: hypothetical protein ACFFCQ_05350 [Promethearchaeota archaeon]